MSKPYIRLYNVFTDDCDTKLNPRQLYFYSLLATMKSIFLGYTLTTLSLICRNQIVFTGDNENRKLNDCRRVIDSLVDKKVILIESDPNIKANTLIKISFPDFKKGFEDFNSDLWNSVSSPDELMVFTMLKRILGFEKSKDQWSKTLGYASKNTGNDIITQMEKEDKIYSVEGNLYTDNQGRIKQYPTKWYLGKKPEKIEKKGIIQDVNVKVALVIPDESGTHWGNWKGIINLTDDDYQLYAKQENNDEFMKVAKAKIKRITNSGKNVDAVYAIEKSIEKGRDKINEAKIREQAALNVKVKSDQISIIKSCKGIPIVVADNGVNDLLIDDIDSLKLEDKIYFLHETEHIEQGYYIGTKVEIEKYIIDDLIRGKQELYDDSEFIKFNKRNIELLFGEFKRIIRDKDIFDSNTLKQLTIYRNNLISEQNEGLTADSDWEGDVYMHEYPDPEPSNKSKQKRYRENNRLMRLTAEKQRLDEINKSENEEDQFAELPF